MTFQLIRMRRNRKSPWIREMIAENSLTSSDLIYPIFIVEGKKVKKPIKSMPPINRLSIDMMMDEVKLAADLGITGVALFPSIDGSLKDLDGTEAYNPKNLICRAIAEIKRHNLNIGIISDVALDPYTSHGHDGILVGNRIDNDLSLEALRKQSMVLAAAGADILAPSDMMDGRIGFIREALESKNFVDVNLLSYSAKYASNFYGPFRDAVGSKEGLQFGKETYQMDPRNAKEALEEMALDIEEGADMLMVKPGMPYLDIVRSAADRFNIPIFAYQVSGEYAMMKFGAEAGILDWDKAILESLISFKRAGARGIFTYAALDVSKKLSA